MDYFLYGCTHGIIFWIFSLLFVFLFHFSFSLFFLGLSQCVFLPFVAHLYFIGIFFSVPCLILSLTPVFICYIQFSVPKACSLLSTRRDESCEHLREGYQSNYRSATALRLLQVSILTHQTPQGRLSIF